MRGCSGKQRHETKREASDHRAALSAARGLPVGSLAAYRCEQCLGYHVGNAARVQQTRLRRSGKRKNKRMRGR
jgi:hypothetical protein